MISLKQLTPQSGKPYWLATLFSLNMFGCASHDAIQTAEYVDIDKYMGSWYVIAHIPTFLTGDAYNSKETYTLNKNGTIATEFSFNEGGFEGEEKVYHPKGVVKNKQTNAHWGMQFIWPFKAEYLISYVDEAYETTIVARSSRDYIWLMSRSPGMSDTQYDKMKSKIESLGYDMSKIRKVPQQAEETR